MDDDDKTVVFDENEHCIVEVVEQGILDHS